eukprot:GHRR01011809.1.p1 GENE.GHRR01011809.1~~GHRR01011809.1.p1  ORF type:complete len:303 (+),score=102.57 GHRR01011809.1:136-1044(+)
MAVAAPSPTVLPVTICQDTQLEYLIKNTQACVLRPYCFFVSWQGVLTLAYRGFPKPLVALKEHISDFYPALPKESPGSKWPKTSLACLKEGNRLTPEQLQHLNELCRQQSGVFQTPGAVKAQALLVDTLSTIVYETRCLERVISRHLVQLVQPTDMADAAAEELTHVQGVIAEADDKDYWYHASRDGNRENHYRNPALGVTLVHEPPCFTQQRLPAEAISTAAGGSGDGAGEQLTARTSNSSGTSSVASSGPDSSSNNSSVWSSALPGIIAKFRAAVEAELPGMYAWFSNASLHVTVRAIIV